MNSNSAWFDSMPKWFKIAAVIFGLLSLGAAGGKTINDVIGYRALIAEIILLRQDVQRQTCIQVAQLRHGDWTDCLIQPHAN